jgi:hypothetical protein
MNADGRPGSHRPVRGTGGCSVRGRPDWGIEGWGTPITRTRAERAVDLEAWADRVSVSDFREADTGGLRAIAELVDRRDHVEEEITAAVRAARQANRSWSEIGAMLGVSKQAAQRKYGHKLSA